MTESNSPAQPIPTDDTPPASEELQKLLDNMDDVNTTKIPVVRIVSVDD